MTRLHSHAVERIGARFTRKEHRKRRFRALSFHPEPFLSLLPFQRFLMLQLVFLPLLVLQFTALLDAIHLTDNRRSCSLKLCTC